MLGCAEDSGIVNLSSIVCNITWSPSSSLLIQVLFHSYVSHMPFAYYCLPLSWILMICSWCNFNVNDTLSSWHAQFWQWVCDSQFQSPQPQLISKLTRPAATPMPDSASRPSSDRPPHRCMTAADKSATQTRRPPPDVWMPKSRMGDSEWIGHFAVAGLGHSY